MLAQNEINFPVEFTFKVIMDNAKSVNECTKNLKILFVSLKISFSEILSNASRNGNYNSFSSNVKIQDRSQFDLLYKEARNLPGVKFAV
ncbi:DUF493 family protein [Candidatus Margulisiibacteriota bacterium]